jgi:hypothetical protein
MHDGEQLLNYLGESAIFGTWLLLHPELLVRSGEGQQWFPCSGADWTKYGCERRALFSS